MLSFLLCFSPFFPPSRDYPINLRAFVSLTQALCAAKAAPCSKRSLSPTWPQKRAWSPLTALAGWCPRSHTKPRTSAAKSLDSVKAVLQEDDSVVFFFFLTGTFHCLVIMVSRSHPREISR